MPRKIETIVYTYDELSPEAQAKARDWWREASAGDNFFAECVTDNFLETLAAFGFDPYEYRGRYLAANDPRSKRSSVQWSGFWSQGSGASFGGTWRASDFKPDALLTDRPEVWPKDSGGRECPSNKELHRIAKELRACIDAGLTFARLDNSGHGLFMRLDSSEYMDPKEDCTDSDDAPEELADQFLEAARDLAHAFYKELEAEYEYQNSDDQVAESIRINDYEFTEEGERP